jgi:hypothetical protein
MKMFTINCVSCSVASLDKMIEGNAYIFLISITAFYVNILILLFNL